MAFIFLFYAFIVSLKFGETETRELFGAWGAAYLWTALIFDPCNVCVVTNLIFLYMISPLFDSMVLCQVIHLSQL